MTVTGRVEKIIFQNTETAWSIILLKTEEKAWRVSGIMPALRVDMHVSVTGELEDTKYGKIIRATEFSEVFPEDVEGIEKYLASGLIRNIGPVLAHQIVETFGLETLHVLDNEPERLGEVRGIGKKRVESIIKAVKEQTKIRSIMIWLKRYDLSNSLAAKIYKAYGDEAIEMLEENPYRLTDDIGGVGFRKADSVALKLGITVESPKRISSGIVCFLEDSAAEGNTCVPLHETLSKVASEDYLSLPQEKIDAILHSNECPALIDQRYVFLPKYYYAEIDIAKKLGKLQRSAGGKNDTPNIERLQRETGIYFSQKQKEAICTAMETKVSIITGGPGTGKTVITNAIIHELERLDLTVLLCAPTGRAAKRMNEVTEHDASTIHRLLGYTQSGFEHDENMPLSGDAIIIDEASMIDTVLMKALISAIPPNMKVIIVGDVDQLPSVGAGCVLRDLIDCGCVPVTHLTEIYRQAQGSDIIMGAHAVNNGMIPVIRNAGKTDLWFFSIQDKDKVSDIIVDLVQNRIPSKFGFKASDIQVLSPMRRDYDCIGATQLNRRLQAVINPTGEKVATKADTEFRVGDRIMQTKNDYDKGIFNGDLGVIKSKYDESDEERTIFFADFDGQSIGFSRADLQNIELAYACTVHKSQGSEYPVVIMPVHESQFIMLRRNLLYTGITRAKRQCILVGTHKALAIACQTEDTKKRYTMLKQRIINLPIS